MILSGNSDTGNGIFLGDLGIKNIDQFRVNRYRGCIVLGHHKLAAEENCDNKKNPFVNRVHQLVFYVRQIKPYN